MHGIYMSRAHHPSLAVTSEMRTSDQCDIHLIVIGRMIVDNVCFFRFATDVFRSLFIAFITLILLRWGVMVML